MLRYLALGDSYTFGEGVEKENTFPYLWVKRLKTKGLQFDSPQIIAQTGWTTSDLLHAIRNAEMIEKYDLITLLIGVNNQYQQLPIEKYKKELEQLLTISLQLKKTVNAKCIVLSIPDYSVTPFAVGKNSQKIAEEIDEYNRIAFKLSKNYNIPTIDITTFTRKIQNQPHYLVADQLHPSKEMYQKWVDILMNTLTR